MDRVENRFDDDSSTAYAKTIFLSEKDITPIHAKDTPIII